MPATTATTSAHNTLCVKVYDLAEMLKPHMSHLCRSYAKIRLIKVVTHEGLIVKVPFEPIGRSHRMTPYGIVGHTKRGRAFVLLGLESIMAINLVELTDMKHGLQGLRRRDEQNGFPSCKF